jgi:hypothetical protein
MFKVKIAAVFLVGLLLYGAYWKLWDTAYEAGKTSCKADAAEVFEKQVDSSTERLAQVLAQRDNSRKRVIELNEIIKNPTPVAPTVTEIIKYRPAVSCKFGNEFKRLLNKSWQDGHSPSTSVD